MENHSPRSSFFRGCASDHPLITSGHVITSSNLYIPWIGSIGSARRSSSASISTGSIGSPPPDSAEEARRKLKRILHLRSPLSSIENLNPLRVAGPASKVVSPMKVGTKEDDVLVMDAVPFQISHEMAEQRGSRSMKPNKFEEERRAQGSRVTKIQPPTTSTTGPRPTQMPPTAAPTTGPRPTQMPPTVAPTTGPRPTQMPPTAAPTTGPSVTQIPAATASKSTPLSKQKSPQKVEALPAKREFIWPAKRAFIWPPTKEENSTIRKVLYEPSDKKRLPIFEKICPDGPDPK